MYTSGINLALDFSSHLGLLPINYSHNQVDQDGRYALINGYHNNICIDVNSSLNDNWRDCAWSSNIANYIQIKENKIVLYNLYRKEQEDIPTALIYSHIEKFNEYLSRNDIQQDNDPVDLLLSQFRIIRNDIREEKSAELSIKALLYFISKIKFHNVDMPKWAIPTGARDVFDSLSSQVRQDVQNNLSRVEDRNWRYQMNFLLRHSAGRLFEEANYIARFSKQLELFPTDSIIYQSKKNIMGSYFTPVSVARAIVERSLSYLDWEHTDHLHIFDPACGSCVFLVEALRQLKTKGYKGDVFIEGWDIDPIAKVMSDYIMAFEQTEWKGKMSFSVKTKNSLNKEDVWPENVDLILMNPPYMTWSYMNDIERGQANAILGSTQKVNKAALFYYQASKAVNTRTGVIGCLIPTNILDSEAHFTIRNEVHRLVHPAEVCHLGSFVFRSAFTDVCSVILSNNANAKGVKMVWTSNYDDTVEDNIRKIRRVDNGLGLVGSSSNISIYHIDLKKITQLDQCVPIEAGKLKIREIVERGVADGLLCHAGDMFNLRMGARTGNNKVFILSSEDYKRLPAKERKFFRPSVDNEAIDDGELRVVNYLFYPYDRSGLVINDEDELKQQMPYYYTNKLLPNKEVLSLRSDVKRSSNPHIWWKLSVPRPWQYEASPKMISTEFGGAGSFSFDRIGNFVVERGMAWGFKIPVEDQEEMYYCYLAILNSKFANTLFSLYSRQLAGGMWYNLENKYLQYIPLPRIDSLDPSLRDILYSFGIKMLKGLTYDVEKLNRLVKDLYNIYE